ncbi:MAG TPA: radical SAM protein [Candidatus Brocadiia bacterium]|nr:radical SAM protein [Candidatus Brocadiia bacterium]
MALTEEECRRRIEALYSLLSQCRLCPRKCGVDRLSGQKGFCGIGKDAVLSSAGPHHGEEPPISGRRGSGTIFFAGCNLLCVFCQNCDISHGLEGDIVSPDRIAQIMLHLQDRGCHNINVVTPTHVTPQIIEALAIARGKGLFVPLVYNCGGYESVETIRLLDGLVEIYMPDMKFGDSTPAGCFADAPDYPEVSEAAIKEMRRQVGDLEIRGGIAVRGLLVRHLVMPDGLAGSRKVLDFLAEEVSPRTAVNVMNQYRPCHKAFDYPGLDRMTTPEEYLEVYEYAIRLGLRIVR